MHQFKHLQVERTKVCDPINDYDDIQFVFVIGGDGIVHEGRSFDVRGEHLLD